MVEKTESIISKLAAEQRTVVKKMKRQLKPNINQFSPNLFWDTDEQTLDPERHARFIIERVLMRGRMADWTVLKRLYGPERIKQEALKIRYLDKVTLSFCSTVFHVPKSKFRCYKQPQSIQQLWQF